ncbi:hypothetical protein ACU6U9_11005 [Pseudomonas sp. HK3]
MNIYLTKSDLALKLENSFFFIVFICCWVLNEFGESYGRITIVFSILSSLLLLIRSKNLQFLFQFFAMSYWIVLYFYFFYGVSYHIYDEYQDTDLTIKVVILQSIFIRLIYSTRLNYISFKWIEMDQRSSIVFYLCCLILACFAILSFKSGGTILGVGYIGSSNQGSILFEYAIIPLLIASAHSKTRAQALIVLAFIFAFMLLPLLVGKRLPFLYFALAMFGIYFQNRFKSITLFFGGLLVYMLVQLAGEYRDEFNIDNYQQALLGVSEEGIMENNQGGVTVASTTYIGLSDEGVLDGDFALKSIYGHIIGVVLPSSRLPEETFFNTYSMKFAHIPGNGGYTAVYLYVLFGWVGVILGGLLLRRLASSNQYGPVSSLIMILIMTTFPRWFGYNLYPVIKLIFWALVLLFVCEVVRALTSRRVRYG